LEVLDADEELPPEPETKEVEKADIHKVAKDAQEKDDEPAPVVQAV